MVQPAKRLQQFDEEKESPLLSQNLLSTLSAQFKKALVSKLAEIVQWGGRHPGDTNRTFLYQMLSPKLLLSPRIILSQNVVKKKKA